MCSGWIAASISSSIRTNPNDYPRNNDNTLGNNTSNGGIYLSTPNFSLSR